MKFTKKNGGFTLVELIVVIAILAILAAIAVPAYSGYISKANEAADQQLLAAVNTAFAAACLENNVDMLEVDYARIKLDDAGHVAGVTYVEINGKSVTDAVSGSFPVYFAGNEQSAFKVYTGSLYYTAGMGGFVESSAALDTAYENVIKNYTTQIGAVNGSAFATIGANALLSQVDSVAGLAGDLIAAGSDLTTVVLSDDYVATLAGTLNMSTDDLKAQLEDMQTNDPEGMVTLLANSTVLNVANTMNDPTKMDETETLNMLQNANFGGLGTTLNTDPEKGLAQAALLYGMYTAYNPNAAKELDSVDDLTGLMSDDAFKAYLAEVNTEGSQAQKDYQGYKSALEIVNGAVEDSPDVANQILNGSYSDPELVGLLGSIIGG